MYSRWGSPQREYVAMTLYTLAGTLRRNDIVLTSVRFYDVAALVLKSDYSQWATDVSMTSCDVMCLLVVWLTIEKEKENNIKTQLSLSFILAELVIYSF